MYQKVYLLSLEDFSEEKRQDRNSKKALLERAFLCVDDARREKAEGMRPGRAREACLGAGLLLQLAVREAVRGESRDTAGMRTAEPVRTEDRIRTAEPMRTEDRIRTAEPVWTEDRIRTAEPVWTEDRIRTAEPMRTEDRIRTVEPMRTEDRIRTVEPVRTEDRMRTAEPTRTENRIRAGEEGIYGVAGHSACGLAFGGGEDAWGESKGKLATDGWECYSVSCLTEVLESGPRLPLTYAYGRQGKPYLREYPFCFSLSHSGDYVLCALSGQEIGADIQRHQSKEPGKIARRFFAEQEIARLEAAQWDEALFFRLWARKEAYGKLTGEGVAGVLGVDLLSDGQGLVWEERDDIPGYSIAICRYAFPAGKNELT